MDDKTIAELDDGIREIVIWLDAHGFETTDSGDGSKSGKMEGALNFPHVFMVVDPIDGFAQAGRLIDLLEADGYDKQWSVELSYSPKDGKAVLMLLGTHEV